MHRPFYAVAAASFVLIAVWAAALSLGAASAQTPASPAGGGDDPVVVSRTVLPDGTIEIRYLDGSIRRLGASDVQEGASQRESGAASEASRDSQADALIPAAPPEWLSDPESVAAFREALHGYYGYRSSGYQHRQRVFAWQLFSSKVIFATVLVLVFSGIAFAALQFYAGFRRQVASELPEAVTQLDLSTTGLKVSSPVLGVIILVLSLAFFYLYLVHVYPIAEIF